MSQYVALKEVLPKDMDPKHARALLRRANKFKQHEGRWEFPKKTAERVESYLIQQQE